MKKVFGVFLVALLVMPFMVFAKEKEYVTTDLEETLTKENIEHDLSNYKKTDDQITIYMFRGSGCGYCAKFLTYLSSLVADYGDYFQLEAYEVWGDTKNSNLLDEVAEFLDEPAGGVPYIIIGNQVFPGYNESYADSVKQAIIDLYNTPKNKRYDIFVDMKLAPIRALVSKYSVPVINLIVVAIATTIIMCYVNHKYHQTMVALAQVSAGEKIVLLAKKNKSEKVSKIKNDEKKSPVETKTPKVESHEEKSKTVGKAKARKPKQNTNKNKK